MIVDTAKAKCTIEVLTLLSKDKSKYNELFKTTKFSHTTLQNVLKKLEGKKIIHKNKIGEVNTEYEITEKGKILLEQLKKIKTILS